MCSATSYLRIHSRDIGQFSLLTLRFGQVAAAVVVGVVYIALIQAHLANSVRHACVRTARGEHFLPHDKLESLVTREKVILALEEAKVPNAETILNFVFNQNAKRLFLILVQMTDTTEGLSLLRGLQSENITDESLPIDFGKDEEDGSSRGWYGYSLGQTEAISTITSINTTKSLRKPIVSSGLLASS